MTSFGSALTPPIPPDETQRLDTPPPAQPSVTPPAPPSAISEIAQKNLNPTEESDLGLRNLKKSSLTNAQVIPAGESPIPLDISSSKEGGLLCQGVLSKTEEAKASFLLEIETLRSIKARASPPGIPGFRYSEDEQINARIADAEKRNHESIAPLQKIFMALKKKNDPDVNEEILKELALEFPDPLAAVLGRHSPTFLNIPDQKVFTEIMLIVARHGEQSLFNTQESIEDEKDRIRIAEAAIDARSGPIAEHFFHIHEFAISDKEVLLRLALKIVAKGWKIGAADVASFGDRETQRKIAYALINHNRPEEYLSYASNFDLDEEMRKNLLQEALKKCTAENLSGFIRALGKHASLFGKDHSLSKEISKIAVLAVGHLKEIKDDVLQLNTFETVVNCFPEETSAHFHTLGIEREEMRLQMALKAAGNGHTFCFLARYIQNYNLTQEADRIEVLLYHKTFRSLAHMGDIVNYHLENFGISDQNVQVLFDFVNAIIETKVKFSSLKFIKNQKDRISAAMMIAERNPSLICPFLRLENASEIENESDRTAIFKKALIRQQQLAQESEGLRGREISILSLIDEGIDDPKFVFEILLSAAEQKEILVSARKEALALLSEEKRIKIAKLMAEVNLGGLLDRFQNYNIQNPKDIFEILQIGKKAYEARFGPLSAHLLISIKKISAKVFLRFLAMKLGKGLDDREYYIVHFSDPLGKLLFWQGKELFMPSLEIRGTVDPDVEIKKKDQALQKLYVAIKADPKVSTEAVHWFGYYLELCSVFQVTPEQSERLAKYAEEIIALQNPTLRYKLSSSLIEIIQNNSWDELKKFAALFTTSGSHALLFQPLLLQLYQQTCDLPSAEDPLVTWGKIGDVLSSKHYRAGQRKLATIDALYHLLEAEHLSPLEKFKILEVVFSKGKKQNKESIKTLIRDLQLISSIIAFEGAERLISLKSRDKIEEILQGLCIEKLGIGEVKDFAEKFEKTFGNCRHPNAIFIYAAKVAQLGTDKQVVTQALGAYFQGVLEGTYKKLREEYDPGSHLDTIFKARPDLKKLWNTGDEVKLKTLILPSEGVSEQVFDIKKYFSEKVADKHISEDPEKEFPEFTACLKNFVGTQTCLEFKEELEKKQAEFTDEEKGPESKKLQNIQMQLDLIALLDPEKSAAEKIALIGREDESEKLLARFKGREFAADLSGLAKSLAPKKIVGPGWQEWLVIDTDNAVDMLLLGTEVYGSCQRIDGQPDLNKCLLGYAMDGKNRLVAIKNERGQIVARCILRLLWDDEAKQPVLYQERFYQIPGLPFKAEDAINAMVFGRAKGLNVALCKAPLFQGAGPYHALSSLSGTGKAPFEYVDAGSMGVTEGVYKIPAGSVELVWAPS